MASAVIGALRVTLGLDSAAFTKGLTAAQKQLVDVSNQMKRVGQTMATVGAGLSAAITAPLIAAGFAASKAAAESADAMGQVEASLKSMGSASGKTKEELAGLASGIMRNSLYDDDEILRDVTANLLTFGKVAGREFDRAQVAIADVATKMKKDLLSTTILVGKALNDPVKGLTAMGKAGIAFTAGQKEAIKSMVAAGNAAGAQRIILAELERQFGGSAAAAQETDPYDRLRDSFNDLTESAGGIINGFLVPMMDKLAGLLERFNNLTPEMQKFVVIGAGIAAALGPALIVIGSLTTALAAVLPIIVAVGGAIAGTLTAAMAGLLSPLGLVIAAVTALAVAAIYYTDEGTAAAAATKELKGIHEAGKTAIDKYREATQLAAKANGQEKKTAIEAANAKRQQVFEIIKSAQAKLAEATATLSLVRAEQQLRMQKGFDPEGAAGQVMALGRSEQMAEARAVAAAKEIQSLMGQLVAIERSANTTVKPVAAAVSDTGDAIEKAGKKARGAKLDVRDFAAELLALEKTLASPEQRSAMERTEQIKLMSDAFEKGALKAAELARMLRLLDEQQQRDAFAGTIKDKPDGNVTLKDGPPDMTSWMGEIMTPETKEDLRKDFQDFGLDFTRAVRAGDLGGFFLHLADQFAAKLSDQAFGAIFDAMGSAGSGGGGGGNWLSAILGAIPGFKTGGSFKVGGSGGADSQLMAFRATPGEMVDIRKPGNDNGPGGGAMIVRVDKSKYFDVEVQRINAPMTQAAARAGTVGGASTALSNLAPVQRRNYRLG